MSKTVYTLKKKKDTQELHLFRATPTPDDKCTPEAKSICKGMASGDMEKNIFACKSEQEAREECAKAGRKVCGTCVSHLYETY